MRLDKYLCECKNISRRDAKTLIKEGHIKIDDVIIKDPQFKVPEALGHVFFDNTPLVFEKYRYYILNKPKGRVSAVTDNQNPTIMECLKGENLKDCFPVGRLDIDTEGLIIITNDGELSHRLLSPKSHVPKTYFALLDCDCPTSAIDDFKSGIDIGDEKPTLPAKLIIGDNPKEVHLTITEGRFHQVKRMFAKVGCKVLYLKRESIGTMSLGDLSPGEYIKTNLSLENFL